MSGVSASYESLYTLYRKGNPEPEKLRRALLLAGVMRWFAEFRGFGSAADTWATAGLIRGSGMDDAALRAAGRVVHSAAWLVGPEGDFSPDEYDALRAAGVAFVSLGDLILRTETAAIYGLCVLGAEYLVRATKS